MRQTWTTDDFEQMSWHDCHVHGFRLAELNETFGTADLEFDIDFICEWLPAVEGAIHFRVAPATLRFHGASDLRLTLDFATPTAGMTPFSIDGIERTPLPLSPELTIYRWRLPISWPTGEVTFRSRGFTQSLRRDPVVRTTQCLTSAERSG